MGTTISEEIDFESILQNLTVGMIIRNSDGHIISINQAGEKILGLTFSQLQERNFTNIAWRSIKENGSEFKLQEHPSVIALRTGKPVKGTLMGISHPSADHYKWISIDAVPLFRKKEGKPYQVLATFTDVSDKIEAQQELRNSEKKYRTLVDNLQTSVIIIQNGAIRFANNALKKKSGYNEDELTNLDFIDFIHPKDRELVVKYHQLRVDGKKAPETYRARGLTKNGRAIWLSIKVKPVNYEGVSSFLILMHDIDAQVRFEKSLKKSEANFRNLFEHAPIGLALVDQEGYSIVVNDCLCDITGYSKSELMKLAFKDITHPEDVTSDLNFFMELQQGERDSYEIEKRYIHKKGHIIWGQLTVRQLKEYNGQNNLVIGMVSNITERKKAEEELIIAKKKAEESNRLKSAFLAIISHELRTPLNAIIGFSDIIKITSPKREIQDYATIINNNGYSLLTIIDDILDLALAENGRVKMNPEKYNLNTLYNEFSSHLNEILNKSGKDNVKMLCFFDPKLRNKEIVIDKSKVFQVIINLMKNAVKFTEEGYIRLGCYTKNQNSITFSIKDTGIGISREQQDIIFEFFRQGDDSHTRKYGGIGVGLALSKRIAEAMNGDLTVESSLGEGALFEFTIPLLTLG